ncbi:DeoR/GlpR transcriptional regulator [Ktedonosporobacter rubrisoli]|uniref:Lactose phosphotransferase system repressor n=1 Tax=Ktedonosporobacter rubrisoli TaxID=2509675 RepID=A0A4P6K2K7_KTERU|nr:DeoR/GlpR family DNA-binding transcription regulator [Ktedonosporobacter rubrisoli]QBD81716.1 DeoR/GlpR transcriptional regulator [Ktedonosporobacter rubrisoli]
MFTAERRQYILRILQEEGKVVAKKVSEELGTSEDTIRRDLRELAAEGLLQRVHGGALPYPPIIPNFAARQQQAVAAKSAMARAAVQLIRNGQVILIDGGTTNLQVAQHIPTELHATVITNSPPVAVALADHPHVEVVLLGGRINKSAIVALGAATIEALHMVRADLYLPGICGVHPEIGISGENLEEAHVQRTMMARAAEVIALVAPEKLNTAGPYIIGPMSDLTEIITEQTVPDELLEPYRALGISVTCV